jgi:hypothetical protein
MLHKPYPLRRSAPRRNRRSLFPTAALVALSLSPLAYFADFGSRTDAPTAASSTGASGQSTVAASAYDPALVDPTPALKTEALAFTRNAPLQAAFRLPPVQREAVIAPPPQEPPAPVETAEAAPPVPVFAPLPVPRPTDLRAPRPSAAPQQMASAPVAAAVPLKAAALPGAPEDKRSFLERLFGVRPASPPDPALAYAALDKGTGSISPTARFSPGPDPSGGTAVYDITAQVVVMPNGERLEAHSGLGDKMDDPRYVNVRMKGATPPGTYILTEREALFHGVRALRLNPVGGSPAIYGRDGILAHTYLLGPRGDSNGCVSFKDYDRFLQAYLRGEVKRLIVTAGRGQDLLPRMAGNRTGVYRRQARNG